MSKFSDICVRFRRKFQFVDDGTVALFVFREWRSLHVSHRVHRSDVERQKTVLSASPEKVDVCSFAHLLLLFYVL